MLRDFGGGVDIVVAVSCYARSETGQSDASLNTLP